MGFQGLIFIGKPEKVEGIILQGMGNGNVGVLGFIAVSFCSSSSIQQVDKLVSKLLVIKGCLAL